MPTVLPRDYLGHPSATGLAAAWRVVNFTTPSLPRAELTGPIRLAAEREGYSLNSAFCLFSGTGPDGECLGATPKPIKARSSVRKTPADKSLPEARRGSRLEIAPFLKLWAMLAASREAVRATRMKGASSREIR